MIGLLEEYDLGRWKRFMDRSNVSLADRYEEIEIDYKYYAGIYEQ